MRQAINVCFGIFLPNGGGKMAKEGERQVCGMGESYSLPVGCNN
jgi:hypothetical protein